MKPKLLFLCQNLPFPPDGGALIRSFHTLRLLSQRFDVTAMCFYRRSSRPDSDLQSAQDGLKAVATRVHVFPIPQEHSRLRWLWDHFRSVVGRRAYTRWTYESSEFRGALDQLLSQEHFHIVHLDSLDLVGYLPALKGHRVAVAHHNVESQLLSRRAESCSGAKRAYLRLQAWFTEREERRWCPKVDLNTTVSEKDAHTLGTIATGSRISVVPNGVDTEIFRPTQSETHQDLVFVGGYTWFPNREGMEFFVDEILPRIRKATPSLSVTWVGRAPQDKIRQMRSCGIHMTGYVPDVRPFVARAKCFIVPIRVGGGTRLKILDAWAMGKAVISTPEGCEGLRAIHGENILIARSNDSFANEITNVLTNHEIRRKLEHGARKTVEEFYDWSVIGEPMLQDYSKLTAPHVSRL